MIRAYLEGMAEFDEDETEISGLEIGCKCLRFVF